MSESKSEFKTKISTSSKIELSLDIGNVNKKLFGLKKDLEENIAELLSSSKLTQSQIDVLKLLINTNLPLMQNMYSLLVAITKDNLINSKDIPYIIQFIKSLYVFLYTTKKDLKMKSKDIQSLLPGLLKYVVSFLLKDKTDLPAEQIVLLEMLIDSTIDMLQLTSTLKVSKCF